MSETDAEPAGPAGAGPESGGVSVFGGGEVFGGLVAGPTGMPIPGPVGVPTAGPTGGAPGSRGFGTLLATLPGGTGPDGIVCAACFESLPDKAMIATAAPATPMTNARAIPPINGIGALDDCFFGRRRGRSS